MIFVIWNDWNNYFFKMLLVNKSCVDPQTPAEKYF